MGIYLSGQNNTRIVFVPRYANSSSTVVKGNRQNQCKRLPSMTELIWGLALNGFDMEVDRQVASTLTCCSPNVKKGTPKEEDIG